MSEDQGKPETPGREEKPPRRPQITSRRFLATAPASSAATSGSPPEGGKPPPGADPESLTPWQVNNSVKELHSVVHSHDVSALQKELADDSLRAVINVPHPESGRTALHEAVASVLPDVASHLLDCGADPNVAHPQEGCSLLHAAAWGNAQLIRLLTDHGANVNSADPAGYTALHYASKGGHAGAVKELLGQGASVRAKTGEGATPLEMAANTRVRLLFNPAGDGSDERGNSSSASGQGSPAKGEEESGKDEGHEDDMGSPQLRRVRRRQEEESQRRDSGGGQEERERMREVLEAAGNIASAMERRGAEEEGKELRSQVEMFQGGVEMDTGGMQWSKGEMLGQGAYGEVYAGLNRRTGELMAVKHIKGDERSEELREMEREIEVCKQLRHKHIVGYIACQRVSPSELYVFLEYVPGGSITQMLVRFGRFEAGLVAHYTRQILHGLEYLHGKRIVHRDLKGGNALVTRSGVIKLADFGAAKALTDQSFNSTNRSLKGSLLWMPPEVVRGHDCTTRGDIWSLACTTVEMFTGAQITLLPRTKTKRRNNSQSLGSALARSEAAVAAHNKRVGGDIRDKQNEGGPTKAGERPRGGERLPLFLLQGGSTGATNGGEAAPGALCGPLGGCHEGGSVRHISPSLHLTPPQGRGRE